MTRIVKALFVFVCLLALNAGFAQQDYENSQDRKTAVSADGAEISYIPYGGDSSRPGLVFIHGWSCDGRYWNRQVTSFAGNFPMVVIDLAGHGHSGMTRTDYTVESFAQDVAAVLDALPVKRVILIGHSMGGGVALAAVPLLEGKKEVLGVIGVDSLHNLAYKTADWQKDILDSMRDNFRHTVEEFVRPMLRMDVSPNLAAKIIQDMCSAPPEVAISAMRNYMDFDLEAAADKANTRIFCISCDLYTIINAEFNKQHSRSFDGKQIANTDHFLMMRMPDAFNQELYDAIEVLSAPLDGEGK